MWATVAKKLAHMPKNGQKWPKNGHISKMNVRIGKMAIIYWIPRAMGATVQKGT